MVVWKQTNYSGLKQNNLTETYVNGHKIRGITDKAGPTFCIALMDAHTSFYERSESLYGTTMFLHNSPLPQEIYVNKKTMLEPSLGGMVS